MLDPRLLFKTDEDVMAAKELLQRLTDRSSSVLVPECYVEVFRSVLGAPTTHALKLNLRLKSARRLLLLLVTQCWMSRAVEVEVPIGKNWNYQ